MADLRSIPRFPPELIDLVIDYNHSDKSTLKTCGLVSKQWTSSSRFHLFSSVTISHDDAREFIQFLSSPYCTFSSIVKHLTVQFVPGSQRWFGEFSRRLSFMDQVNISSIQIRGSVNTVIRVEALEALSTHFNHIQCLEIRLVVFESFAYFSTFLSNFLSLESLSCSCMFRVSDQAQNARLNAPLRHVNLESPSTKPVLEFLSLQNVLPAVITLSLSYLTSESYNILVNYLTTPNYHLNTLRIFLDRNFSGATLDDFIETLDMTHLHALNTLRVETTPHLSPEQASRLLRRMDSKEIKTLEISVALVQGIAGVDLLLTGDSFPSLKKVTVIRSAWDDVRQCLPRCDFKNILRPM